MKHARREARLRRTASTFRIRAEDTMRPMCPIPIAAAERIAREYGYDQVVIVARRVGTAPEPHGEHVTTYGVDREHCASAAAQGRALKRFMGWPGEPEEERLADAENELCRLTHHKRGDGCSIPDCRNYRKPT